MDCCRAARLAGSVSVADQAWALLLQVAFERVHAHFAAAVAELDLAPLQAKALHELNVEPPISMRELAERLKSDPSNITGLIDSLEARGLVERRPDPNDRRVKGLALTSAGTRRRSPRFGRELKEACWPPADRLPPAHRHAFAVADCLAQQLPELVGLPN